MTQHDLLLAIFAKYRGKKLSHAEIEKSMALLLWCNRDMLNRLRLVD